MSRPHPGTQRSLAAPLLQFHLLDEVRRLREESDWTGGRRAITLAKQSGLRVVLMALLAGATVDEHLSAGALTVQLLQGRARLTAGGKTLTLAPGELLVLEPGLPHEVHALDDTALLLTLAQPREVPTAG